VEDTGPNKKALRTYEAGAAHDPENEELNNGLRRAEKELLELHATTCPELKAILSDPVKRQMFFGKYLKK